MGKELDIETIIKVARECGVEVREGTGQIFCNGEPFDIVQAIKDFFANPSEYVEDCTVRRKL